MQNFTVISDKQHPNNHKGVFLPFDAVMGMRWIEFQFRKTNDSPKNTLANIEFWKEDSLYVNENVTDMLVTLLGKHLNPAPTRYNKGDFSIYEAYIFTKEETTEIIEKIKEDNIPECEILIQWLEKAAKEFNGFLFIGL